jgi:hypothetical protein
MALIAVESPRIDSLAQLWTCFAVREVKPAAVWRSADGSRVIFLLEASGPETVRDAFRSAEAPFDRAWPAEAVNPPP